jgi:DNA repair protein RadC
MRTDATWPAEDRPRERITEAGPGGLSDSELLALLIGTGHGGEHVLETARRILSESGGLEALADGSVRSIGRMKGMGRATAARIVASMEMGLRVVERRARRRMGARFTCSRDIHDTYRARLGGLRQEVFVVVALNNRNEIIREETVAKGSVSECPVEPREVFRPLIAAAASRAVLLHNHPSGDPSPSPSDVALTRRLSRTGRLVGIPILDHVIVTPFCHASFRDLGLLEQASSVADASSRDSR